MSVKPIQNDEVADVFQTYPPRVRSKLMVLRKLILQTAAVTEGVGEIEEALRWGEPAYLTTQTKSGSAIRIGWKESRPRQYAMYFHCQTNLIAVFRERFPDELQFEGNRSIVFAEDDVVPVEVISVCIARALTYHRDKKERNTEK